MRVRACVAVAVAVLAIGVFRGGRADVAAQGIGPAALEGVVSSQEEGKMEGVLVTARKDGAIFTVSVMSDNKGRYSFPRSHVTAGKYALTIRAAGYDLVGPGQVDVPAGKKSSLDLKLQKTKDLASQLTSVEWINSMSGTEEQKGKMAHTALSCAYCHTYKRIMKSKHTPEQWVPIIKRMQSYYPDGAAVSDDGRGRGVREPEFGGSLGNPGKNPERPSMPGVAPWGGFRGMELPEYLSTVNLSGGRTANPFELKTLPRPTGKSTRVIITQWDVPRKDNVTHDASVDSKGNLWYTDESKQFFGMLNPRTNEITEWPLAPVSAGSLPGARDVGVDKNDNIWFPVRIDGGASVMNRYNPKTQKLEAAEGGAYGQFTGVGGDGNVWTGTTIFHRINAQTMKVDRSWNWSKSPNIPAGGRIACYQIAADSKGNPWCTGYFGSYIITADKDTGAARFWPTPTPNAMPRRNRMDAQDRFWFGEYTADQLGMFDTNTEKFQEWKLPKYSTPYAASAPDALGRVYLSSNTYDSVFRVDTKTGEVVRYLMPTDFDSKRISIDPSSTRPTVLMANTRNARMVRIEPLD